MHTGKIPAACLALLTFTTGSVLAAGHTPEQNAHSAINHTNLLPSPAFTTVISARELAENHYRNVAEALAYAPGVIVTPGSVNTGHPTVRIDGDDRVAVFIDGKRQNTAAGFTNGRASYDLDLTPPVPAIERIEILHASPGDQYLNYDTPGGVINIITKKGSGHHGKVEAVRGPYSNWRWNAQLEGSGKGWSWIGTGGRSNLAALHYKSAGGKRETMPNSQLNRREMYYRFDKQLTSDSSLNFTYGHFSSDTGLWYSRYFKEKYGPLQDYNYEKLSNNLSFTYNYKESSAAPAYVTLYHSYDQGDIYRPAGTKEQTRLPSYSRWKTHTDGLDWRDGWQISKDHTLSAGLSWRRTAAKNEANYDVSRDPANEADRSFGKNYQKTVTDTSLFVKSARRFNKLTLTGTQLLTHNSEFGTEYLSSGAMEYRPDQKTAFYGALQRIYATPSLDELYDNNVRIKGNPDLEPEKGWKLSGGIRRQFTPHLSGNVGAFFTYTKNPILWARDSVGVWRPDNYEGLHQQGFLLSLTDIFSPKYSGSLSYTYTHSKTNWGAADPSYTEKTAPHQLKASLRYKDGRWNTNLYFTAGAGRDKDWYSGNYYLVDATVNYTFNKHWSSYVKILNLLDESYELLGSRSIGEYPAYGRTALFGVVYSY